MIDEPDYYALLGVSPDADAEALRLAYRVLARRYHPDIAGTGSLERMQQINQAYTVLSDPEAREAYHLRNGLPLPGTTNASTTARSASNGNGEPATPPRPRAPSRPAPAPHPSAAARPTTTRTSGGPFARIATLSVATEPVAALASTADGERVGIGTLGGGVSLWAVRSAERVATLSVGAERRAGVLQGLCLSPSGTFAAAWGFALGISVWQVHERRHLWSSTMSAPRGLLDAALREGPPSVRLALPAAQQSLADIDPFRWAHDGRRGTALLTRPLEGPRVYGAVESVFCLEDRRQHAVDDDGGYGGWRVGERLLSADGRLLLTFVTVREPGQAEGRVLSLWDTEHRAPLVGTPRPRRIAHVREPGSLLDFPLAATPDLDWVALSEGGDTLTVRGLRERTRHRVVVGGIPEDARLSLASGARYVALARSHVLDVYAPHTGERCQRFEFPAEVSALTFSGGDLLVVGLANGQVELWRAG